MAGNPDLVADKVTALRLAERMGCRGAHQHPDGKWMPCETMEEYEKLKDGKPTSQKTGLDIIEQNRRYRSRKGKKKRGWEPLGERGLTSIDTMAGGGLTGGRSGTIKALWAPRVGDTDVFTNARQARRRARELGCIGISRRRSNSGKTVWMPCSNMTDYQKRTGSTAFGRNWQRQRQRREIQSAVEREVRRQLRRKESLTELLYSEKALGQKLRRARVATTAIYDPNAIDGDADALVQEGTPFERPALPARVGRRAQRMAARMRTRQTRQRRDRDPERPNPPMSDAEIDAHYADWLERNPGYIDDATPHIQSMLSPQAHEWAEGLRSRRSSPDGKPSKIERAKKKILDRVKPEHRNKDERTIHWVLGSPGTGKTHLVKTGRIDAPKRDEAAHINPDDLKPHLPGYDGANGDSVTHMQSVHAAAELMDSAAVDGMDMVVQGTGKNSPLIATHIQEQDRTRKKNVKSVAHLVYGGTADTTNDRIDRRNADPHTKQRNRPFGSDRELLEERMRVADQIERGWFDDVYIYDNSGNVDNPPLIAYRTRDGNFEILDRQKFNDYFGDQRHPLDAHGRTGAKRVEEAWIAQRDGTDIVSGERGRGWGPERHFDTPIPGDGRTYREILNGLGYEEQTQQRPKPLQGPPTPRGLGYDARTGLLEEEEDVEDLDIPYYDTLPDPDLPDEEMQTSWAEDLERRVTTNRERRRAGRKKREREEEEAEGLKSRIEPRGVDPVEDTYDYGRGLRSVKRRNEESLETLKELGGHWSFSGMTPEQKRAWIDAEMTKVNMGRSIFVPSARTGKGHFTDIDSRGRDGKERILAAIEARLANYAEPHMRHNSYVPASTAHLERLREFVESHTPEELHAAVLKWGRELYEDPDNLVGVMDTTGDIDMMFNALAYKTTHTGGLRPASSSDIRTGMEVLHGYPANTPEGLRPASGFLIPGAMVRRLRARLGEEQTRTSVTDIFSDQRSMSMLSQSAGTYGETMMILRPEVKERSRVGAGDMLNDIPSVAPMVGATDDEIVDALISVNGNAKAGHTEEADIIKVLERVMMGLDGSSLGDSSENLFREEDGLVGDDGNRIVFGHGYHEVLIHGSFTPGDIQTIVERGNDRTEGGMSYEGENSDVVMKEIAAAIDDAKALGLSQEDIDTIEEHLTRTTDQPPRVTAMDISDEIVRANSGQIRLTQGAQRLQHPRGKRGENRERAERMSRLEDTPMEYRYTSGGDWHGIDWENPSTYQRQYEEGDTLDDVIRKRRKESFESIAAALREPKKGGLASKRESAVERETTIAMVSEWLELAEMQPISDKDMETLRAAEQIVFSVQGVSGGDPGDRLEVFPYQGDPAIVGITIPDEMRATVKRKGVKTVGAELTPEEASVIEKAMGPDSAENLINTIHDHWTSVAGGHDPGALLTQLSMARSMGWSDEQIEKEIFHAVSKTRWNTETQEFVPMDISYDDLKERAATLVKRLESKNKGGLGTDSSGDDFEIHQDPETGNWIARFPDGETWEAPQRETVVAAIETQPRGSMRETLKLFQREMADLHQEEETALLAAKISKDPALDMNAESRRLRTRMKNLNHHRSIIQALALEHYYGESYRAALAAEQRATAKRLKAQGIETVTLYRGVIFSGPEAEHLDGLIDQPPRSLGADRPGSPLTSWSVSDSTARMFADMVSGANEPELTGYLIKSEVSVDDIVGLSTHGFGCLPEGECIVRHGEQTVQVLERYPG